MRRAALTALLALAPATALAGNIANCEVVIMEYIEDESGGGMDIASFRDAGAFLAGVYDDEPEVVLEEGGYPIRALMCTRKDLMPDEDDYRILATGVPFAVSQNFDSTESDSLTIFFRDGAFEYKYASAAPMDDAMQETLEARLADFSGRDHGLGGAPDGADEKDVASDTEDD